MTVHSAEIQARNSAKLLLSGCQQRFLHLEHLWADGGYRGQLVEWAREEANWTLEIVEKSSGQRGVSILPRHWVVERTFAWLGRYRRLIKDHDLLPKTTEAFIHLAMIRRLAK